jgi:hypothetical protein
MLRYVRADEEEEEEQQQRIEEEEQQRVGEEEEQHVEEVTLERVPRQTRRSHVVAPPARTREADRVLIRPVGDQ